MKIYDKAVWHIDGGELKEDVLNRFVLIFEFLKEKNMLNENGLETLEYAMDSSVSLNSSMLTLDGKEFLDDYYDEIIKKMTKQLKENLEDAYEVFDRNENEKISIHRESVH